ncbi:MAG: histidinol-phosphate transaminase [Lachnospiraceae bacterium]|nr:histidinol-phosphate transaminase [Lachnospiraceae bacterium]
MSGWEEKVRTVVPYVPGEQPAVTKGLIKLNTNELPYPPSSRVMEAITGLPGESLRLYPDIMEEPLLSRLAERYGVSKDEIFIGVGSDDVLAMAFLTFFHSDRPVLFPDITYSFYDVWAELYRIPYETVPLLPDFRIEPSDYFRENGGIVLANPNAPTSLSTEPSGIEDVLKANPDSVVIVDEAYVDFGGETVLPLVPKYENLLVVQTFSKSRALAGMRIGFAIGNKKLIGYLNDVKFSVNSYTMNRTAVAAGAAALSDEEYFKKTVNKVIETRERAKEILPGMGFRVLDSKTNFLFVSHEHIVAADIYRALREKQIYVRHFAKPRIDNYLRISVGTDEEMQALYAALHEITG